MEAVTFNSIVDLWLAVCTICRGLLDSDTFNSIVDLFIILALSIITLITRSLSILL